MVWITCSLSLKVLWITCSLSLKVLWITCSLSLKVLWITNSLSLWSLWITCDVMCRTGDCTGVAVQILLLSQWIFMYECVSKCRWRRIPSPVSVHRGCCRSLTRSSAAHATPHHTTPPSYFTRLCVFILTVSMTWLVRLGFWPVCLISDATVEGLLYLFIRVWVLFT